ncbi:MAG: GrpB family protein [Firmicutes bacterium]|nr:GrpB family protein [Bacillota bacterium]
MGEGNERKIEVVNYSSDWKKIYNEESKKINEIMGYIINESHHIGSTSIPGIKAKPVIDILIIVEDIKEIDKYDLQMKELGYVPKGEYGIKGRRFFMKGGNNRTHHVHIYEVGNEEIERHINFKDYLISHPDKAKQYSELKEKLAQEHTYDIDGYIEGKSKFIKEIDKKAKVWKEDKYDS